MRRYISIAFVSAVALGGAVLPAFAQSATTLQKLQQLKQQRDAARQAAQSAAALRPPPPPPPTVTAVPTQTVPPRFTVTPPPPPPPTNTTPRLPFTATNPLPTVTAPPLASTTTVASARPKVADPPKAVDTIAASLEKLRTTRADRRHAEVERMQQRWGELVSEGRAQGELRLHAQRVAYLQRIRAFAERANDAKLVESVDQLITQEERRDGEALNTLRTGGAK